MISFFSLSSVLSSNEYSILYGFTLSTISRFSIVSNNSLIFFICDKSSDVDTFIFVACCPSFVVCLSIITTLVEIDVPALLNAIPGKIISFINIADVASSLAYHLSKCF